MYKIRIQGKHINDVCNPVYDVILNSLDDNPSTAQEEPYPLVLMPNPNAE
jgi:hypothetical protein